MASASTGSSAAQALTDHLFGTWLLANQSRIEGILEDVKAGRPLDLPTIPSSAARLPSPHRTVSGDSMTSPSLDFSTPGRREGELDIPRMRLEMAREDEDGIAGSHKRSPHRPRRGSPRRGSEGDADMSASSSGTPSATGGGAPESPPSIRVPSPSGAAAAGGGGGGVHGFPGGRPPLSPSPRAPGSLSSPARSRRSLSSSGRLSLDRSGASTSVIPRFYVPGEGGRGRGRPVEGEQLERKLPELLEVWRAQHREMSHKVPRLAAAEEELARARSAAGAPERESLPPVRPTTDPDASSPPVMAPRSSSASSMSADADGEASPAKDVAAADADLGLSVEQFAAVAKALCGFPSFFAAPLFRRIRAQHGSGSLAPPSEASEGKTDGKSDGKTEGVGVVWGGVGADDDAHMEELFAGYDGATRGVIRLRAFLRYWRAEMEPRDPMDRLLSILASPAPVSEGANRGSRAVVPSDFMPFLEELLAFHPGLAFLESTPEFQEKYARTVVARIYYHLDPEGTGQINARQLRRSSPSLLEALHTVDMEEDINVVTDYFSYEHFYVLYCKFWELDADHDFLLTRADLYKLQDVTEVCLRRVFEGAGRPRMVPAADRLGYEDFVFFFLSEEDKTSDVALRYWFNVVDVDGDGVITVPDMKVFYDEQFARMQELGLEAVQLRDIVTQMTDLLEPEAPGFFRIQDFLDPRRIRLTGVFFSALFNVSKFQAFEARNPVLVKQELNSQGVTQWDRYASLEYVRLADEEERGAQDEGALDRVSSAL